VCGIVTLLVLMGSFFLIKAELKMVHTFMEQHQQKIDRSFDNRKRSEQENLQEFMEFIGEILNRAGSGYLFHHQRDKMIEVITPYMRHDAIGGIQIVENEDKPFAAMWKIQGFLIHGEELPEIFLEEAVMKESLPVFYDEWNVIEAEQEQQIGRIDIYFSNDTLAVKIDSLKEQAARETEQFVRESEEYLQRVILSQILGIGGIVLVLVLCLILFLQRWVRKPLLVMVESASKLGDFDLTLDIQTTRRDEIGKLLQAIRNVVQSFRTLIGEVQRSGIQVSSSAAELSATARQQESVMTTQVHSTANVLNAVREISDLTEKLARTMQQVVAHFQETSQFANSGQEGLTRMEEAMQRMETASMSVSSRFGAINEKTENITGRNPSIVNVKVYSKFILIYPTVYFNWVVSRGIFSNIIFIV
jgi:methyl-accepting chemotaxis protein